MEKTKDLPQTIIERSHGLRGIDLRGIWEYRDLLLFLTWRDISARYKQTILGSSWAILQPLASMVIFSIFFGGLANIESDGLPYPIFSYAGLLPWMYFAGAVTASSQSLVSEKGLITKVYFPRLVVPLSSIFPPAVDFLIAFIVLIGMMIYYGIGTGLQALLLPLFLLLAMGFALGIGLWLSALNVLYRDIRILVPFMVQFGLYVSPIVYPSSLVPEQWRLAYGLNPMATVIEGFRWALLNTDTFPSDTLVVSIITTLLILIGGAYYFRWMEKSFADIV